MVLMYFAVTVIAVSFPRILKTKHNGIPVYSYYIAQHIYFGVTLYVRDTVMIPSPLIIKLSPLQSSTSWYKYKIPIQHSVSVWWCCWSGQVWMCFWYTFSVSNQRRTLHNMWRKQGKEALTQEMSPDKCRNFEQRNWFSATNKRTRPQVINVIWKTYLTGKEIHANTALLQVNSIIVVMVIIILVMVMVLNTIIASLLQHMSKQT